MPAASVAPTQDNQSAFAPTAEGYHRLDYAKDQLHHVDRAFKDLHIVSGKKMSAPRMVAANRTIQGHQGVGPSTERSTERHLNWNHCVKQHVMDSYVDRDHISYAYVLFNAAASLDYIARIHLLISLVIHLLSGTTSPRLSAKPS